ncbi:MAG: hypothetical protein E5V21_26675, partial [Mesorhizobium sp.]
VMKLLNPGGFAFDSLLIAAGIAMQFVLAYYLEWLSGIGRSGMSKPVRSEVPPVHASFGVGAMATTNR